MALAQPTGLQVQILEPLIAVDQSVERNVPAGSLVILHQVIDDSASVDSGGIFIDVTQVVDDSAVIRPAETLLTTLQMVDDSAVIRPAQTLASLDQTILTEIEVPRQALINLQQIVARQALTQRLIRVRQISLVVS